MPDAGNQSAANPKNAARQAAESEGTSRLARRRRAYLFGIGLIAVIGAFTTLTILVKTMPFFPIDLAITRALQSIDSPLFAVLMSLISWPGFSPQSIVIPIIIVGLLYALGFRWEAIAALFAAFFAPLVNVVVKEYIRRPRPAVDLVEVIRVLDSYSFPSGHVMYYVCFFGFLWFLACTLLTRSRTRTILLTLLGFLIAAVGISRIYLGQHWASDVLGAYLLGSLCLVITIELYRWGKTRFFAHPPAPEKAEDP